MKTKLLALIATFLVFISMGRTAEANDYSAFVGTSQESRLPGTVRIGLNSWEIGLITDNLLGVDDVFRADSTYASWGLGYVPADTAGLGFYAAVGWEPKLFWALTFRCEINAVAGTNAFVKGGLYVGLGLHL